MKKATAHTAKTPAPQSAKNNTSTEAKRAQLVVTLAQRVARERPDIHVDTIHALEDQLERLTTPEPSTMHTFLTLNERDAIDNAKGRALRLTATVKRLLEATADDDDLEDESAALCDLLDLIQEDLGMITVQFLGADDRQAAAKGGA
jgi:hypothetical protein